MIWESILRHSTLDPRPSTLTKPQTLLGGSGDLVTRVKKIGEVYLEVITTPMKVVITLLTKSHDPPSRP